MPQRPRSGDATRPRRTSAPTIRSADATIATIGGSDPDGLAAYLLRLGTPLRVLSPDDVREALRRRIRDLLNDQEG
jgi:predicted DNA-binding transcriptional regulator YafY